MCNSLPSGETWCVVHWRGVVVSVVHSTFSFITVYRSFFCSLYGNLTKFTRYPFEFSYLGCFEVVVKLLTLAISCFVVLLT